jgi:hypothetical protein
MSDVRGSRRRRLGPLLGAEIASTTGSVMTMLALPWLVLTTTGSPARAGFVAAAEWVPMALLGIPSGSIATRLGPLRTMMTCDAVRAPIVALIPILYWLDALPYGVLLGLACLLGACFPAHFASQRTILPALLGEEHETVTRGNVLLQGANRLPLVAGPAPPQSCSSTPAPTSSRSRCWRSCRWSPSRASRPRASETCSPASASSAATGCSARSRSRTPAWS